MPVPVFVWLRASAVVAVGAGVAAGASAADNSERVPNLERPALSLAAIGGANFARSPRSLRLMVRSKRVKCAAG